MADFKPDDLYGPDGRHLGATPLGPAPWAFNKKRVTPRCAWCAADRYAENTGRCPRCNEPYYDNVLYWPGVTSLTLHGCAVFSPETVRSVVARMGGHRGISFQDEVWPQVDWLPGAQSEVHEAQADG